MTDLDDDRGLRLGDGLFETLLARDGRPLDWAAHVARLVAGCAVLGLPAPREADLRTAAEAALAAAPTGEAALRLTWTAGAGGRGLDRPADLRPRLLARATPYRRPEGPLRLVVATTRRNEGSPASRVKALGAIDAVLARREARRADADEALMLNNRGELACAAAGNLFWRTGARLRTPALDCGVLAGTVRARLIAAASGLGLTAEESRARPEALAAADGIYVTNSLIGVRPVASVDGRPAPDDPMAPALARAVSGS